MTEDPYNNDAPLAADHIDSGDEFDGLEVEGQQNPKGSKAPVMALIALVVVAVGAFLTYQIFMANGNDMPKPAKTIAVAQTPPTSPATPAVDPLAASTTMPSVTAPATPPGVVDPNAPSSTPPAPIDPNAPVKTVSAEALPTPAAAIPPGVTDPAMATPVAPVADAPAVMPPAVTPPATTTTTTSVTPATDVTPAAATTTTTTTTPVPVTAAMAPAPSPAAVGAPPAPTTDQLKPIDPNAVMAKAGTEVATPLPTMPGATPSQKKVADTVNAVNDILGTQPTAEQLTKNSDAALAKQVEVTPRAHQVIFVKKSYNANSPQATVATGDRVSAAGQYSDAVEVYDRELKKNPSNPLALAGKAVAEQKAGRDVAAMDTYQRLIDLNPRDVEALTNYLGLLQKQNPSEALARLQTLSKQYPESASVAGQLAATQAGMMDTPNALRNFQKAVALDPGNPIYSFNLGVLYDRLGTSDKARESYRNALASARENPDRAGGVPLEVIRQRLGSLSD